MGERPAVAAMGALLPSYLDVLVGLPSDLREINGRIRQLDTVIACSISQEIRPAISALVHEFPSDLISLPGNESLLAQSSMQASAIACRIQECVRLCSGKMALATEAYAATEKCVQRVDANLRAMLLQLAQSSQTASAAAQASSLGSRDTHNSPTVGEAANAHGSAVNLNRKTQSAGQLSRSSAVRSAGAECETVTLDALSSPKPRNTRLGRPPLNRSLDATSEVKLHNSLSKSKARDPRKIAKSTRLLEQEENPSLSSSLSSFSSSILKRRSKKLPSLEIAKKDNRQSSQNRIYQNTTENDKSQKVLLKNLHSLNAKLPALRKSAESTAAAPHGDLQKSISPKKRGRKRKHPLPETGGSNTAINVGLPGTDLQGAFVNSSIDGSAVAYVGKSTDVDILNDADNGGSENDEMQIVDIMQEEFSLPIDPNEPLYCTCQQPSFGKMIGCDGEDRCKLEWFHLECVGLKRVPNGSWYCDDCIAAGYAGKKKK